MTIELIFPNKDRKDKTVESAYNEILKNVRKQTIIEEIDQGI